MQKNVSGQKWIVYAFNRTTLVPITGDAANITANLRIDGGPVNAVDDTNPTELENGYYFFTITQAETIGSMILISPISSTSDIQVKGCPEVIFTTPANFPALSIETDGDLSKVNSVGLFTDDVNVELSSVPNTTATMQKMIQFLFQYFRNRRTVTAVAETMFKENGSTALGQSLLSDNGATTDKGEMT